MVLFLVTLNDLEILVKLDDSSRSRDMAGVHQNLNGSRDLNRHLSEKVCHSWAGICCNKPIDQM